MINRSLKKVFIAFLIWLIGGWPTLVFALPQDGQIVSGSGDITEPTATSMQIDQYTGEMIINWNSFNIGSSESVNFSQPGTGSIVLNRVIGADPSLLLGNLTANGQVFITNGSGVFFGPGSKVDVHGLIATTMAISDQDFLDRNYNFSQDLDNPLTSVINEGIISATVYVGLLAPAVENRGTIVVASLGSIDLAAGKAATLDFTGDGLISFAVTEAVSGTVTDKDGNVLQDRVSNSGLLKADGGQIRMSAKDAGDVIRHVVNMEGVIEANTVAEEDGWVILGGGSSGIVSVTGTITATGDNAGEAGGEISVAGKIIFSLGTLNADGKTNGGKVNLNAEVIMNSGSIQANGQAGNGGTVAIDFSRNYLAMEASSISANGTGGGSITIDGGSVGRLFTSGTHTATGSENSGGIIYLLADEVRLVAAHADVSGTSGGGTILIGGDYQGQGTVQNSSYTYVNGASTLSADALASGNGGKVIVWSDGETEFSGNITARGGSVAGDGGLIEVSGKANLLMGGEADASAVNGVMGTLLLDPKNITVDDSTGVFASFDLVDPNANGTGWGSTQLVLSTGNIVVVDITDNIIATDSGAVYLYNGLTGALISTLTGSAASDQIGSVGVTELTNGNFVVASEFFDGGSTDLGAATFINGTTGLSGVVSSSNSLVGTTASDQVGSQGVTALTNGNYVVISKRSDVGGVSDGGAVTFGSGTTGISGAVSTSNSLYGTTLNDFVGNGGITALTNGNYVVMSQSSDVGGVTDGGAVAFGDGTTGVSGAVSTSNSLYGALAFDFVGIRGVTALSNGNYVVIIPSSGVGGVVDGGAVTFGDGTTGITGAVTTSNSLYGTTANDFVGSEGVIALTNGNYVVISQGSDVGGVVDGGAVTFGDGTTGITGAVSTSNSLYGTTASDFVGQDGVTALTNGNYVVISSLSDVGGVVDGGAVTFGDGTTGISGAVSTSNSLYGTAANDFVGNGGVTALTNGNYVVISQNSDVGGVVSGGAVTFGDGTTGISGAVSTSNSLYGTTASDQVGATGVTALTNGNYVVISATSDVGGVVNGGAVTFGSGTTGISGAVSTSNSLYGTAVGDLVGSTGVTALTNGNYVVASLNSDVGGVSDSGAVTFGSGTTGITGAVTTTNSLYGTTAGDQVGNLGITELTNGGYVVTSSLWDNGGTADVGAATFVSGTTGLTLDGSNTINAQNSVIGTSASTGLVQVVASTSDTFLSRFATDGTGRIAVGFTDPNLATFSFATGASVTVTTAFITATLNAGTAVTLQASNDITITSAIVANNAGGAGGLLLFKLAAVFLSMQHHH